MFDANACVNPTGLGVLEPPSREARTGDHNP